MQILVDSSKKYFWHWFTPASLATIGIIWATFVRPQIVMASDLQKVVDSVERLETKVDDTATTVNKLARAQMMQQQLYYEDQIRILEVYSAERSLTPTEHQRLLRYKSDLRHLRNDN